MKRKRIRNESLVIFREFRLQIRQKTSAVVYDIIILPVIQGRDYTKGLFSKIIDKVLHK